MKRTMMAWLLACFPVAAFSAGASGPQILKSVQVDSWDQFIVIMGPVAWQNPDACGISNVVVVQASNPMYKDILASVLAAGTAGEAVNLWLNGCVSTPWGGTAPVAVTASIEF